MQKGLVSKLELQNMEVSISKNTKLHIAQAVDPIKSEICDLRLRVQKIEDAGGSNPGGSSQSAHGGASTISPEIQKMLNSLDPAHKRVAFTGFPENMAQSERTKHIEKHLFTIPALPKLTSIGMIFKGPKNARKPTKVSYIEFSSSDDAREVAKMLKNSPLVVGESIIHPKPAITKQNAARNWALREAERLVKASPLSKSDTVKIVWDNRNVENDGLPVFTQLKDDLKGIFSGVFADLTLP